MNYRTFGRLGWAVSEIGYGTWGGGAGPGGWQGGSDEEFLDSMRESVHLGCNFFDTASVYGHGHSERLVGTVVRSLPEKKLYVATKIPPKNMLWPCPEGTPFEDVFPESFVHEYLQKSLTNLGLSKIDLIQFHVWQDSWASEKALHKLLERLKLGGLVQGIGISINTWEPWNVLKTLETGLIDSVQVIYNVFEQQPEDKLFPFCSKNDIAVITRVPFDEGMLTGQINQQTKFAADDWRSSYFVMENLREAVPRAEKLKKLLPPGMSLPEMALRFILENKSVSTVIPGMRRVKHVHSNLGVSDGAKLPAELMRALRQHRWDRSPTAWSQ